MSAWHQELVTIRVNDKTVKQDKIRKGKHKLRPLIITFPTLNAHWSS